MASRIELPSSSGTTDRRSSGGASLRELLEPRIAVEEHFARVGHTYRHGRLYRQFEHAITRPVLRAGLKVMGLYHRGLKNALSPIVRRVIVRSDDLPAAL